MPLVHVIKLNLHTLILQVSPIFPFLCYWKWR